MPVLSGASQITTLPMHFDDTVPYVSAAQLASRLDRAGPICWSIRKGALPTDIFGTAEGSGICGKRALKHVAQFTVMTSIGIFGGVPANTTVGATLLTTLCGFVLCPPGGEGLVVSAPPLLLSCATPWCGWHRRRGS